MDKLKDFYKLFTSYDWYKYEKLTEINIDDFEINLHEKCLEFYHSIDIRNESLIDRILISLQAIYVQNGIKGFHLSKDYYNDASLIESSLISCQMYCIDKMIYRIISYQCKDLGSDHLLVQYFNKIERCASVISLPTDETQIEYELNDKILRYIFEKEFINGKIELINRVMFKLEKLHQVISNMGGMQDIQHSNFDLFKRHYGVYEINVLSLINYIKTDLLQVSENKPELSLKQIALIYAYRNSDINDTNKNHIAKKYGYKSGDKLKQYFNYYRTPQKRIRVSQEMTNKKWKNKIELFESVLNHLLDKEKTQAEEEINILKAKFGID
jgi:hypothetical protein